VIDPAGLAGAGDDQDERKRMTLMNPRGGRTAEVTGGGRDDAGIVPAG